MKKVSMFLVLLVATIWANTTLYQFTNGKKTGKMTCSVEVVEPYTNMRLAWDMDTMSLVSTVTMDKSNAVLSWKSTSKNMNVSGKKVGDSVFISGINNAKLVDKKEYSGGISWHQMIPFDMTRFALSKDSVLLFHTIPMMGPQAMKFSKMRMFRMGEETITVLGKQVLCIHTRMTPTGLFSKLWHGDYWFRKTDGLFVHSEAMGMPGAKPSSMDIIDEK